MNPTLLVKCSNCGDSQVVWSQNMRLNSKGLMKHWLINANTGQDHRCMSWSRQGGRDAIIPGSPWTWQDKEAVRIKHERYLAALEASFRSPWTDKGELKPEYEIGEDGMIHRRHQ